MKVFLLSISISVLFFSVSAFASTVISPPQPLLIYAVVIDSSSLPSGGTGGNQGGSGSGSSNTNNSRTDYSVPTSINFSGRAYPLSKVSLLKDGELIMSTIAGPDSKFTISLNNNLSNGNYIFSLLGEDSMGRKSTLFNVPLYITANTATTVSGVFITPTITVDKSTVAKGDNLAIFGQSVPSSKIIISIHSPLEIFKNTDSDTKGVYLLNLDTSTLDYGGHEAKSKASLAEEISSFSPVVNFNVGKTNILNKETKSCIIKADLNNDCKVNLVDFSVLAYWYKKSNFAKKYDLNNDGKIDIKDFSIMAYYWTG